MSTMRFGPSSPTLSATKVVNGGERTMRLLAMGVTAALLTGALASVPASAAPAAPHAIDRDAPQRKTLPLCKTMADRDCIESLGLVTKRGFVPGKLISTSPTQVIGPVTKGDGQSGPTTGTSAVTGLVWRLPGLKLPSGEEDLGASISLTTPGLRWYDARADSEYDVVAQLEARIYTQRWIHEKVDPPCEGSTGECGRPEPMSAQQGIRLVIRTSWFQPAWARSHLGETVVRVDPLAGGGSRILIEGTPLSGPGFYFGGGRDPLPSNRDQFDYFDRQWTTYMFDANDPKFPFECAQFGFPLISGNQWGSGTPTWTSETQQLELQVSAPHLDARGKPFRGHYEAFIPADYARCLWRTDPKALSSRLMIEVTSEDGEERVATTSINYRNRGVRIMARGFTFSSPTITVKPAP
jgi:hypothetical protein